MSLKQFDKNHYIKVVILAGGRDFGRCPLASHLPPALWPVAGKPALERLLNHLAKQGIKKVAICCNGDAQLLAKSIHTNKHLKVDFLDEQLPVGAAGAIRDAISKEKNTLDHSKLGTILVLPASMVSLPKIATLIEAHRNGQSDLTVMFNPKFPQGKDSARTNHKLMASPADIYVCETSILQHIPKEGYFDIKEELIAQLLRAGKTVHTAILPNHVGNFRDRKEYLCAISNYLKNSPSQLFEKQNCWLIPENATIPNKCKMKNNKVPATLHITIESGARIYGPVAIMDGANIAKDAVIFGPTIIGRNVCIGKNTLAVESIFWDGAQIGPNCQIKRCVVDYHAKVKGNTIAEEKVIPFKPAKMLKDLPVAAQFLSSPSLVQHSLAGILKAVKNNIDTLQHIFQACLAKINQKLPKPVQLHKNRIATWLAIAFLLTAFLWCYWPGIVDLWNIWSRSDEYSCGVLVPFLAIYVLWSRRRDIAKCSTRPSLWGIPALVGAQVVRLFGLFFMYGSAERLSIALSVAALILLLFGWGVFRKVFTVLLFMCLMLPWPNRIQAAVTLPLQHWATSSAVFCLEMIGYEVIQEGNIIHIGSATVAVAEACNGLRMITAFFVISGLVVLLIKRSWWEKAIILVSSLPIALLCNTARLTVTALAFTKLDGQYWERMFHDFGGYAMMPLALGMVVAELWLLAKLTTLPEKQETIIIKRKM